MRTIVHLDMDSFFASVEALDHEEYRGQPLIVGGPRNSPRAVVSTCSYEARKYGIRSAMPMAEAVRLCPHGIFVTGRMHRYVEVSSLIMKEVRDFGPVVEQISIDEAFIDMTGCEHLFADLRSIGSSLKERIRTRVGLPASCGIAPNKFLAKLASDCSKPDGLMVITPDIIDDFLCPLSVRRIWGVGDRGAETLKEYGIKTVHDLRQWSREWLESRFGKWGAHIHDLAYGRDDRPVEPEWDWKSCGSEHTYNHDVADPAVLRHGIAVHAAETGRRLRNAGILARTVTLKMRSSDFRLITRSRTLGEPFDDDDTIYHTAVALMETSGVHKPVRLIGVQVSGFCTESQPSLFSPRESGRDSRLDKVLDSIRSRYGRKSVARGRELG